MFVSYIIYENYFWGLISSSFQAFLKAAEKKQREKEKKAAQAKTKGGNKTTNPEASMASEQSNEPEECK